MKSLREILEKKKDDFNDIYYCPKKQEIYLVESVYLLMPNKIKRVRYADSELFGKDKPVKHCHTWIHIGYVNKKTSKGN